MEQITVSQTVQYEKVYESENAKSSYELSIIMPCHNSAGCIDMMLLSLASQKFSSDVEIIFVLDNCTDNTLDKIMSDFVAKAEDRYHITVLVTKSGGFTGVARDVGRSVMRGEYEWHIDSDDYLLRPDAVHEICSILKTCRPPILHIKYHCDIDGWSEVNCGTRGSFDSTLWSNVYKTELSKKQMFHIAFIGDDTDFFDEFTANNKIDMSKLLCTVDYYYYYTQLRGDSASGLWWVGKAERDGVVSALTDYYKDLFDREWYKLYGQK